MNNKITTQVKGFTKLLAIAICFMIMTQAARAQYTNIPLTSGSFNNDVVADGTGSSSFPGGVTHTFGLDGQNYVFLDSTYKYKSSSAAQTCYLPRLIASLNTTGLTYELQKFNGSSASTLNNNALTINSSGYASSPFSTSGTITLSTAASYGNLYLLYESIVNTSTNTPTLNVQVNFTNGTNQQFSVTTLQNWFAGAGTGVYVAYGGGAAGTPPGSINRVASSAPNSFQGCSSAPYLYEMPLALSSANYGLLVQSVTVSIPNADGSAQNSLNYVHVLALGGLPPCSTPSAPTLSVTAAGAGSINGTITPPSLAPSGYIVLRTTTNTAPTAPSTGTTYTASSVLNASLNAYVDYVGTGTTFTSTGLNSSTKYYYWVYSYNSAACVGNTPPIYSSTYASGNATTSACGGSLTSGTIKIGASTYNYTSITAALAALSTSGLTGSVVLELETNYTQASETFPITIPTIPCVGSSNTITIRPASGWASTLKIGSAASSTFSFSNAQYVTIDGRPGGTGSATSGVLMITDSSATSTATIQFINGAQNNAVKYCNIRGNQTTYAAQPTAAVVYFGSAASASGVGNSNNTVSYCNIHAVTATNPVTCIGAYNNSNIGNSTTDNTNNTITNNNIYDFVANTSGTNVSGILISYGNDNYTITNNSIYESATEAINQNVVYRYIWISANNGTANVTYASGFTVTGNYMGGGVPDARSGSGTTGSGTATATCTITSTSTLRMAGMDLDFGNGTLTSIGNNVIQNISLSTTSVTTGSAGAYTGIYLGYGYVSITGNTIGGSAAGSITVTTTTAVAGAITGIGIGGGLTGKTLTITGNTINNITCASSTAATYNRLTGIYVTAGASTLQIGTALLPNTISNLTLGNASTTATNAAGMATGILISGASTSPSVTGNQIFNILNYIKDVGTGITSSTIGILLNSTSITTPVVSGNTIYNVSNMSAATTATNAWGIVINTSSSGFATVSGNIIHSLTEPNWAGTGALPAVGGVNLVAGNANVYNNAIRLGIDVTGAAITKAISFYGIRKAATQNSNIWFNSVYIGGTGVANNTSAANSAAFDLTTAGTDVVEDNIFVNVRTNNAATVPGHYCVLYNTSVSGLTLAFNVYQTAATTGSTTGNYFGGVGSTITSITPYAANWGSTGDYNSLQGDPKFQAPTGTTATVSLNIQASPVATPVESSGVAIGSVTTDILGNIRASYTPTDIGAYAGNFTSSLSSCSTVTLNGGTASASVTSFSCPGGLSVLSISGYTAGVYGLSYQWQSSPTGAGTFTNISGATAPVYTVLSNGNTDYRCAVSCSAGGVAYSTIVTINSPAIYNTFPYAQGFNSSPISSYCWSSATVVNSTTTSAISLSVVTAGTSFTDGNFNTITPAPSEGTDFIDVNTASATNSNSIRLISPPFNTSAVTGLQLQYDYYQGYAYDPAPAGGAYTPATSYESQVLLQYSTDGINWTNVGSAIYNYSATSGWYTQTVNLPVGAIGQSTVFLAFLCTAPSATGDGAPNVNDVMLDNINLLIPCTGTPNAGNAVSNITSACPGGFPVALSLTGVSSGVTGLTYQWQSSPHGANTYTNITGATSKTYTASPTASTDYLCVVTCSNSGLFANSNPVTITVANNLSLPYIQGFNSTSLSSYCWSSAKAAGKTIPVVVVNQSTTDYFQDATSFNNVYPAPSEGTDFLDVQTQGFYSGNNQVRVVSPAFNTSAYSSTLSMQYDFYEANAYDAVNGPSFCTGTAANYESSVQAQYSLDGITWNNIGSPIYNFNATSGWYTQTVTLPSGVSSQPTVYIGFLCTAPTLNCDESFQIGSVSDIYLDNFKMLAPCSGAPVAGTATGFTPLTVTGYNQDVIANGYNGTSSDSADKSTTASVDGQGNYFYDASYSFNGTYNSTSLPINGQIISADITGLLYQLQPSAGNNVLQLAFGGSTSGTLTLGTPISTPALYLLATSGSSASTITAVVNFSDGTSQTFSGLAVPDWFAGGSIASGFSQTPYAEGGFGRVNNSGSYSGTGNTTTAYSTPDMYDIQLALSPSNYSELITSITITNNSATSATSNVVNIFAISIASATPAAFCGGLPTTVTLFNSPTANAYSGLTYQWQSSTANGGPYTNVSGGTGATSTAYTNTSTGTVYYVCDVTCTASGISVLSNQVTEVINPTPTVTITPSSATYCSGQASGISLTASSSVASTYSWSPFSTLSSQAGATVTATPTATTTYTATALANGCTASSSVIISYITAPIISSITATPANVCPGGTSQLALNLQAPSSYCIPSASQGSCNFDGDIVNFTLANGSTNLINNNDACTDANATGYVSYPTSQFTAALVGNNTYNISLTNEDQFTGFAVFIDYDHDGVFEPRELVYNSLASALDFVTSTDNGSFTVPASALNGTTIMRVYADYDNVPTNPCANSSQGYAEVQDYTITISGGITTTYAWTPTVSLSSSTIYNPIATPPIGTDKYKVTVANGACSVNDSITLTSGITLASNPTPTPAVVGHACIGTTYSLSANVTGGGGPYTYSWTSSPAGFTSTAATISVSPSVTTTYSVAVTDNCGTHTTGTYTFAPQAPPTTIIAASSNYCTATPGDTLVASGTATSFTWLPLTNLTASYHSDTVFVAPAGTVTYTVTGTDGYCSSTATTLVSNLQPPVIASVTASQNDICSGQSVLLNASISTTDNNTYCVPGNQGGGCSSQNVQDFSISTTTGTAVISNQGAAGCDVNFLQYNNLATTYTTGNLVAGTTFNYSITSNAANFNVYGIWIDYNHDGVFQSNELVASINNGSQQTNTGSFLVPATALNGQTLVRVRADWDGFITAESDACGNFSNQGVGDGGEAQDYYINITGGVSVSAFSWTPSSTLSNNTIYNPLATPTATTTYTVKAYYGTCASLPSTITIYDNVPLGVSASATQVVASSYCTPTYSNGTGFGDYITNVTLGSINNTTGALSTPYYNYYSSYNTNLTAGGQYTISGTVDNGGTEDVAVWIDYNNNGVFDASEKIGEMAATGTATNLNYSFTFTVPITAISGQTRLRVRDVYNTTGLDPCNSQTDGDVQDYNVTIVNGVSADCGGIANFQLTAAVTGGGQPYHYSWAPATGLSSTTVSNPTAMPLTTTTYTVTVHDSCGNVQQSNVTVTVIAPPAISITPGTANVCTGSSTTLTASGVTNYVWTASSTLTNINGGSALASPSVATVYTVTGYNTGGCPGTDTITIHVVSPPTSATTNTNNSVSICSAGTPVALNVSTLTGGYTGTGNWQYKWTDSTGTIVYQAYSSTSAYTATPSTIGYFAYNVYVSPSLCPALSTYATASFSEGMSATPVGVNPTTCGSTGFINFNNVSGTKRWYGNNFSNTALNGATLYNSASDIGGSVLTVIPSTGSATGEVSIPNPGINSVPFSVNFSLTSGSPSGTGGYGFSYSFADDDYPTNVAGTNPENGTGTKLKIEFSPYTNGTSTKGIYLMYNCTTAGQTPTTSGVLAYSTNTTWSPGTAQVSIVVNNLGQLTLTVGSTIVFYNVQLSAGYISANKSTWTHVFAARSRTNANKQGFAISSLYINYSGFQYSTTTTNGTNGTWLNAPITGLAAGTYNVWMRSKYDTTCFKSLGSVTLTNPTAPVGALISATPVNCGSTTPITIGLTGGVASYRVENVTDNNAIYSIPTTANGTVSAPAFVNAPGLTAAAIDSVEFDMSTLYIEDNLKVNLIAPNGSSISVYNKETTGTGYGFVKTTLVPAGTTGAKAFSAGTAPFTGHYLPDAAFSTLTGNASGTWQLQIVNPTASPNGTGVLTNFAIYYKVNGASYSWSPTIALTSSTVYNPGANPIGATTYVLTISDSSTSCNTTDNINLSVNTPVSISSQPVNSTICLSSSASFSIAAMGTGISYQWQDSSGANNWSNINISSVFSGVTSNTLIVTTPPSFNTGIHFRCIVYGTAPCGNVTSNEAVLNINIPVAVTSAPVNSAICLGSSTTFSVSASGTSPTYQWQDSTTGGWNNVTASATFSNVTTATLSVTSPALTYSGYKFRCVVTGTAPCASTTSASATLSIHALPTVAFSPHSTLSICTGPVSLPVTLTGAAPLTMLYNDGSNQTVTGVTNTYLLNVNPLATTTYHIRIVRDNIGCAALVIGSSAASYADSTRKVVLYSPKGGSVTPALSTVCSGSNQTFSITGDTGTHVQWQYSINSIANSTSWTNYGTLDSSSATLPNITGTTYVRAVVSVPGCVSVSSTDGTVKIDSSAISVIVSNISSTAATINWTPALGATSYTIVYNGNTVVAGNVTSYNLTGLSSCTAYSVSVTSNTSNCGGARNGSGSFNTSKGNLALTLTQGVTYKVTASWSAGVGPYKLYIGSIDNLNSLQVFNVTGTTYTTTNAWPGYTVAAYVVDLGSTCTPLAQSALQQINIAGGNCTTGAPVITARASTANTFTVQWSGSSSNGYQFFYKNTNGSGSWYSYYTAGNSMTINGCAPGNCYAVYVQNVCSNSKGYTTAVDTICTAAVCTAPLNLLLSKATCNGFTATWNSVSGATAYQVYMTLKSASGNPITYSYTVKGSPYTVAIFGKGVAVSVYVKTQNCTGSNGLSAASNVESTTTLSVGCKDGGVDESNSGSMNAATADGTFNVYPNPNNGTFKVSMATLSTNSTGTLEVMDMLGRTLYTKEISNNNGTIVETIDMGNTISSGLYMIRVRCGNDSHIAKVQIQR